MNVDEMPAGREMDFLIAKEVKKWDWVYDVKWLHELSINGLSYVGAPNYSLLPIVVVEGEYANTFMPLFSLQIADAWKVVEKLREDGFFICLEYDTEIDGTTLASCELFKDNGNPIGYERITDGDAEQMPLAICRAAYKLSQLLDNSL